MSDLSNLVDMGFEKERSELALKKTGNSKSNPSSFYPASNNPTVEQALTWLEKYQEKTMDQIKAELEDDETNPSIEPKALEAGEVAQSLVCDDCGKKLRSVRQAEAHGERSGHTNFSESTEEIAPLTKEETEAKLAELKAKAAERKAKQAIIDKEESKKNEKIRLKSTREVQDLKEDMAKKEQIKAAADKRAEKLSDMAAKKRIQDKIAADKEERRLKAEKQKAEREGRQVPVAAPVAAPAISSGPRPAATESRLRLQCPSGTLQKTLPVETTLLELAHQIEAANGDVVTSFTTTYPKKTWDAVDMGLTLKEAGLVPSCVLVCK